jgi:hypothetical protein
MDDPGHQHQHYQALGHDVAPTLLAWVGPVRSTRTTLLTKDVLVVELCSSIGNRPSKTAGLSYSVYLATLLTTFIFCCSA